jgi:hypothetical protein
MFHFIDLKSTGLTLSQDQGKLFETTVREIVSGCVTFPHLIGQ